MLLRRVLVLVLLSALVLSGVRYDSALAGPSEQPRPSQGPAATPAVYPVPGLDDIRPNWTDSDESKRERQAVPVESEKRLAQPPAPEAPSAYDAPTTPQRMIPGDEYTVPVTLTNVTEQPLPADAYALSYHWALADGTPQRQLLGELKTELPHDLAPGQSVRLDAKVRAPKLADLGNKREQFVLNWDVRNVRTGQWWSENPGVAPLSQKVPVEDPTSDQLGLEKFFQFHGTDSGSGSTVLTNQFSGNGVFSYNPVNNPGRGLANFVRLTHNSQDTSNSYAGHGWSVATSSLTRLGSPLQFHGLLPGLVGHASKVTMVDGDGTSHTFELNKHDSLDPRRWTYDEPAGVNMRLQRLEGEDPSRAWVLTRPDRTKAYFDEQGYQTSLVDKNGNQLTFVYEQTRIGDRNTGVLKHITDATGRQVLTFDYYEWGENAPVLIGTVKRLVDRLTNLNIANQLKSITDVSGRKIGFTYDEAGLLRQITDGEGSQQAKTFHFGYDTGLLNNAKLTSVTDPLGNATRVGYFDGGLLDLLHKKRVQAVTDRRGGRTTFDYTDPDGHGGSHVDSAVTNANGNVSRYRIDGYGRPVRLTNAKNETTELTWDADNNVVRMTEPNQATSTWVYDPKTGYPLEVRDAEANARNHPPMRLEYRFSEDGHVADLIAKTTPEGRKHAFGYDERGNLTSVTDPKGVATPADGDYTTRYTHDRFGQLQTNTDANGNTTRYADFEANGYPQKITDPYGGTSGFGYDVVGNVVAATDANGKTSNYTYDLFKRPLSVKQPWGAPDRPFVVTPGPEYDANDNVVRTTAANGAVTSTAYDPGDLPVSTTAPKDADSNQAKVSTMEYDAVGNLIRETEPNGTATPQANDFSTTYTYDQIDQLIESTDALGGRTRAEYDNTGNLIKVADPRKTATPDPNDYTSRTEYDLVHRPIAEVDAEGNATRTTYDRDGNPVARTDRAGNRTDMVLDERASVVEQRVPHRQDGTNTIVNTTRFDYDQVGNRTKTVTPRGVATGEPNDFVQETRYDKMNRVAEEINPYDPKDSRYNKPTSTTYRYDPVGHVTEVSAPPSEGQSNRNTTRYSYFDNGWTKSQEDPWNIKTLYDYNPLGQQTSRTFTDESGASSRTMTWDYHPDGKLHKRGDDGVPAGKHTVLVDNSDGNYTEARGNWAAAGPSQGHQGFDYRTHPAGQGGDSFTWTGDIPAGGQYEVAVKFPKGEATNATYTIEHDGGIETRTVDQSQATQDGWVSLGKYQFTEGQQRKVTLTDRANGTVHADAVRWVRDNVGVRDEEQKTFTHSYDANGNLSRLQDDSPGARADRYDISYDQLNRASKVAESKGGNPGATTDFGYDPAGNLLNFNAHGQQSATYEYDARDLVSKVTNSQAGNDPKPKTTTFSYDKRELLTGETKSNNNKTSYEHTLDSKLAHQVERKADGGLVNEHRISYDANGNRTRDESRKMNADNHSQTIDRNTDYTYDPRDRIREVTKTKPGGGEDSKESYVNDDNSNVIEQTVGGRKSSFKYDRNRLVSATADGATSNYRYDTFGRLDKVSFAGEPLETYRYDGFDRTAQHKQFGPGGQGGTTTDFTYDPLDRTTSRASKGTGKDEKTDFSYLGLGEEVIGESVDGKPRKSYQYSSTGARLSQIEFKDDGTQEDSSYSQNAHSDVEATTGSDGNTQSTYGYTAYGEQEESEASGVDKPGGQPEGAQPQNVYRFNSMRWDAASGNYDMGFRDYDPGLNRFTSMDLYNGALSDLNLTTDPFTQNRYAFGGGNPLSSIELDGHGFWSDLGHAALDVAGLVPVVGEVADLANAAWYAAEGNYTDAALSAAGAIPFVGWGAAAAKGGKYAAKAVDAASDAGKAVPPPRPRGGGKSDGGGKTGGGKTDGGGGKSGGGDPPSGGKSGGDPPSGGPKPAPKPAPQPKPVPPPKPPDSPSSPKGGGSCPIPNSFLPGTQVLMADGSHKPIEQVREGEQVMATDPVTGRSEPRPVVATIAGQGAKNLVEVTVDTDGGRGNATGTVIATDEHPFWVDDLGRWVDASELRNGDWVRTPSGELLLVTGIKTWASFQQVHNLSVEGISTYNVLVGTQDVTVHNAGRKGLDECGGTSDRGKQGRQLEPGQADDLASWMGYVKTSQKSAGGSMIWRAGKGVKGPKFIAEDMTGHLGGIFKGAKKAEHLGSTGKTLRSGTYGIGDVGDDLYGLVRIGE